jgi:NAD(P)-dependent dehydrogenase (short-subunit alcohol dehydrogenase family)
MGITIITGASQNIGWVIAEKLIERKKSLLLIDQNQMLLEKKLSELKIDKDCPNPVIMAVNFNQLDYVAGAIAQVIANFSEVENLIMTHSAVSELIPITQMAPNILTKSFNINLMSHHYFLSGLYKLIKNKIITTINNRGADKLANWGLANIFHQALSNMLLTYNKEKTKEHEIHIVQLSDYQNNEMNKFFPGKDPNILPEATDKLAKIMAIIDNEINELIVNV